MNVERVQVDDVKVVFILGFPRSGSTLLGNILGQVDGWFFAGELRELWRRSLTSRARCGCGQPTATCPVWRAVRTLAVGDASPSVLDRAARQVVAHQLRALRWGGTRYSLARRRPAVGHHPSGEAYLDALSKVYRSIAEATGSRVVVDSSKWPIDGAMAEFASGVQPYFVHLVRDPRGVVFSRQRARDRRRRAGSHPRPLLAMLRPLWIAYDGAGWAALNLLARHARWKPSSARWCEVAYEDLARHPQETLHQLLAFLGEDEVALPFVGPGMLRLGANHAIAGNRNRHEQGDVAVALDESWREGLGAFEQLLVAAVALPSLHAHGYRFGRGRVGSGHRHRLQHRR